MIDIKELRKLAQAATRGNWSFWQGAVFEILDLLESAEKERDTLKANIEMEAKQ